VSVDHPGKESSNGDQQGGTRDDNLRTAYDQLCLSYRAIDDFRSKLLGFLPFVSGAGVLALLGPLKPENQAFLTPIGTFGFLVTLGLSFSRSTVFESVIRSSITGSDSNAC